MSTWRRSGPATWGPATDAVRRLVPVLWPAIAAAAMAVLLLAVQTGDVYLDPADWALGGPGDGWGGTAVIQEIVKSGLNPFAPGTIGAFNAPDGMPVPWQVNIQQWPTSLFMYGSTWVLGDGEVAYNLYVLAGYALNAALMSILVVRLTGDRLVGVLLGFCLTIAPVFTINRGGHPALVQLWPLIGMAITYHWAFERPSLRRGAAAGAVTFFAMSMSGYHLLFAGVEMVALAVGFTVARWQTPMRVRWLKCCGTSILTVGAGLVLILAAIVVIGGGESPDAAIRDNPKFALDVYSARLYEYVIPTASSWLFGDTTGPWLARHIHGSNATETPLYLGVSVLVLAIAGLWFAIRGRDVPHRAAILVCGPVLMLVGIWVSLPPRIIPGVSIPTPSDLIFELVPSWRVYSRLVLVVLVGTFVLAALGLSRLAAGGALRRYSVLTVALVVVAADLRTLGGQDTKIDPPPVQSAINRLPQGPIAFYPLSRGENDGYGAVYNQQFFGGRPVVQGFDDFPQEARLGQLEDLSQPETALRLRALGVRSVVIVRRPPAGLEAFTPPARPPSQLRQVAKGKYGPFTADVYTLSANRDGQVGTFLEAGFAPVEGAPSDRHQWLRSSPATIELWGTCRPVCSGRLRFRAAGLGRTYELSAFQGDRVVARIAVGVRARTISIPLTVRAGKTDLTLRVHPGPRPISELIDSPDGRPASISVSKLRWTASR